MTDTSQTPQQQLDAMAAALRGPEPSANPDTPDGARARMDYLTQNKEWRDKFFAGDVATREEFDTLTKLEAEAKTRTEKVIDGTAAPQTFELTTRDHPLSTRDLMTAGSWLQEVGIRKESELFRSALDGGGITQQDYELALVARDRLMSHAGWSRALLAGNKSAAGDLAVLNIQISAYETEKAKEVAR